MGRAGAIGGAVGVAARAGSSYPLFPALERRLTSRVDREVLVIEAGVPVRAIGAAVGAAALLARERGCADQPHQRVLVSAQPL